VASLAWTSLLEGVKQMLELKKITRDLLMNPPCNPAVRCGPYHYPCLPDG